MTRFVDGGERTKKPESLTATEVIHTLLFGVTIPRPVAASAGTHSLPGARHVRIQGSAGELGAWVVNEGTGPVAILVHGYANESSQVRPTAEHLIAAGYTVVAPDLRAVGTSQGQVTSLGWHEADDVAAVARWVHEVLGDPKPILYGFSMGGAAVIGAAGRLGVPTRCLVVESTFDRLIHTTGHRFETMGLPPRGLSDVLLFWGGVQQGFDPYAVSPVHDAPGVQAPTLVIAGDRDLRITPNESRDLAAAFPNGTLQLLPGRGHVQLAAVDGDGWEQHVRPFLDTQCDGPTPAVPRR